MLVNPLGIVSNEAVPCAILAAFLDLLDRPRNAWTIQNGSAAKVEPIEAIRRIDSILNRREPK